EHTYHTNLGPSPEIPKPFLGAGTDGEGGLQEISVKADKKGLIIGLTCLLRQILYRAKCSSTIESQVTEFNVDEAPEAHQEDPSLQNDSFITSRKCVFDERLKHTDRRTTIGAQPCASATLAQLHMSSNLTSELPLCPKDSLSKIIFEKLLGMKLSTVRLTSTGHSWKFTGIFGKGVGCESKDADAASQNLYAAQSHKSVSAIASLTPSREPTVSFPLHRPSH
ncbi:hypothetical protein VP01_10010g1, partial [Puccinia sorghi]